MTLVLAPHNSDKLQMAASFGTLASFDALRLCAGDTMGFLNLETGPPTFCWFKSLCVQHFDDQNHVCNLEMDSMTTAGMQKPPLRDPELKPHTVKSLTDWSEANADLMQQLRSRITRLVQPLGP